MLAGVWGRRGQGAIFAGATACCCLALATLSASLARAKFSVYPTIVEVQRPAGKAALGRIDVKVTGERRARFRVVVQDVGQGAGGEYTYGPASRSPHSASPWVSVTPRSFAGAPNRVQPIQFQVSIPGNAEPGDHLTSITVQRLAPKAAGTTARSIEAVSVRLTVRVAGPLHPRAAITALAVPGLVDGGPVAVRTTVRNTGNVTLDFEGANRGVVRIRDGSDTKATLPPFEGKLFPGQTREFLGEWAEPPLFGSFDAEAAIRTAKGKVTARTAGFTVLPWREAGALALVLIAAVLLYFGWRRRRYGY
ncbi:MAG: hypothetical protein JSU06_05780 [Actinobacteria bacterium]|nr:hypothetical protein [Actinomycetota bacterium]